MNYSTLGLTMIVNKINWDKERIFMWKEIIKDGWDVFPLWLMALNIFAIAIGLLIILFL